MATLHITIFEHAGEVALGDPIEELTLTFTGTSAASDAIAGSDRKRKRVRLYSDADCYVTWGETPVAALGNIPLGADNPEYFDVEVGHKIAAVTR